MSSSNKDNADQGGDANAQDLTIFVQNLLQQMQGRFQQMSDSIITRIDDMGKRIDDLEKSIGDLMSDTGVEIDNMNNQGNRNLTDDNLGGNH
mmetsp:Transcript_20144/g.22803  ORF Transcript_20144/g.22803 Transcript_20144/m.22803 type:complete len:92 (+) Transcript_20144:64-339(+)|eukprot:CAMPEP_0115007756 /NCGR_PEP_ID=MMETSP0216-20121206/21421_1 /TAXON_ID=223996 /ORGANISM="Protocruzia adherens, Strain Boccale" /LENGTH=91 /DNA_ID=CAMNT_0002374863 /DNA_START=76 /DNA_END=351 /DNA_ORIENTATION=+